jgi:uncharacterized membrane protein
MPSDVMEQKETHRALRFVKTMMLGGLVFLVPLAVLVLLLGKGAQVLQRLSRPLASRLSLDFFGGVVVADAIIVVVLLLVCFLAGFLARMSFADRFVKRAESGVLWRVPGYALVKGLTDSLDASGADSGWMRPVLVRFDDYSQLAFEVDRMADGRRIIYLPSAPEPRAGSVVVVTADRVEAAPFSFVNAISTLRAMGHGMGNQLSPAPP